MQKRMKFLPSVALVAMFVCGVAALGMPLVSELVSYRADAGEYAVMAEQLRPSAPTLMPVVPLPTPTDGVAQSAISIPPQDVLATSDPNEPTASPEPFCEPTELPPAQTQPSPSSEETPLLRSGIDLDACLAQNRDFAAWLTIPGTMIDYPVVRSDDTAYYLHHLFTGKKSKLGCLFSLKSSDYRMPSQNIAIYGHHLSHSNAMFSSLIEYKEDSYYAEHSTIHLDGDFGRRTYRIFAVLNMKVSDWDPATASFPSSKAFLQFVSRAQNKALYETGIDVHEDDHILTLITCDRSYGGVSGRLVVMAVQE